jgi:hypothetical protein
VNEEPVEVKLDLGGFDADEVQILRIDEENRYTLTGEEIKDGVITLPANACAEVKLWNTAD